MGVHRQRDYQIINREKQVLIYSDTVYGTGVCGGGGGETQTARQIIDIEKQVLIYSDTMYETEAGGWGGGWTDSETDYRQTEIGIIQYLRRGGGGGGAHRQRDSQTVRETEIIGRPIT